MLPARSSTRKTTIRPAIPFEIILIPRKTEAALIPREDLMGRLAIAFSS